MPPETDTSILITNEEFLKELNILQFILTDNQRVDQNMIFTRKNRLEM